MTIDTDDMRKFRAEMERLRGAYIMDIAGACDMYAAALARAEAAEAEARRESNTAGEQFAVIARIGETLGIAMSTPNLCRVVQAEVETVKARAEAAEAERDDLRDECSRAEMAAIYFEARVAELEAILASDAADENQYLDAYIDSAARDGATIEGLVARVAELEAQAERHAQDYDALYQDYREMRRNWEGTADIGAARYLAEQRVAELEAQLAAQGWRPVGVNPPPTGRMFEIRRANCSLFPTCAYGKPAKKAVGSMDGEFICWWVFGNGWEWRPYNELQPAPDQEPQ